MKYKIGDKVRVKEDLVAGRYNGVYFNSSMAEQMGKVVTIEEVDEPFYYIKELDYVWVDEMFINEQSWLVIVAENGAEMFRADFTEDGYKRAVNYIDSRELCK